MSIKNRGGLAYLVFFVLASIWKTWNDRSDPRGRSDLAGIYHDEEFHQVVVDLTTTTLYDVNIFTPHALADLNTVLI